MKKLITLILLFASIGLYSQQVLSGDYIKLRPITLPYGVLGELAVQSSDSTFQFYNGTEWVDLGLGNPILEDVTTADTTRWGSGGSGGVGTLQEVTTLGATSDKEVTVDKLKITDAYGVKATHKIGWNDGFTGVIAYEKILELSLSAFQGNTSALNDTLAAYPNYKTIVIDTSITMTEDWTIPGGVDLKFIKGNIITTGAYSITGDNTSIDAGLYQIFSLTSNLIGTWKTTPAYPEWFGANGEGTFLTATGDFEAVQKTLDVFCVGININTGTADEIYDKWASGNWVQLTGSNYWVEQSLDIKPFGDLRINPHTIIKAVDGFFGNYIISRKTPRRIQGGNFIVPNYWEQSGYIASSQLDADKLAWAWNKNPVIYMPMADLMHTYGGYDYNSMKNTVQDIAISLTQGYDRSIENTKLYKYDGIVIECDTTQYSSGTLEWRRLYKMVSYGSGDDFSNIAYTISGTPNTPGWYFVVGLAADNKPFEQLTPTDWTNGSVVQNNTNASYYLGFENIYMQYADTALSLKGDLSQYGSYEGIAGYTFDNFIFDKCNVSLAANSRTWEHSFTNMQIQALGSSSAGTEHPSIILEGSSQNNIQGTLMDMHHDSTVYIKIGVGGISGSKVDMTVQGNRLLEQYTKYSNANLLYTNPVGPTPVWFRPSDNTWGSTSSTYWFQGLRMGLKQYENTTVDRDDNPRSLLELVGSSQYTVDPLLNLQVLTNAYSSNNTVDNMAGFSRAIEIGVQPTSQNYLRPGVGSAISFVAFDTLQSTGVRVDNDKFELGVIGFRQNTTLTNAESGIKSNFQIWQKTAGVWSNTMTIDKDGRMGLKGSTNPDYDLDLSDAGTLRSDNITDDGTGIVEITGGLLNINPLTADPATAQPEGTMWINITDNTFNISINGGVYSIDLTAKP